MSCWARIRGNPRVVPVLPGSAEHSYGSAEVLPGSAAAEGESERDPEPQEGPNPDRSIQTSSVCCLKKLLVASSQTVTFHILTVVRRRGGWLLPGPRWLSRRQPRLPGSSSSSSSQCRLSGRRRRPPRRRRPLRLPRLRQELPVPLAAGVAPARPHGRAALPLSGLRTPLLLQAVAGAPPPHARRRRRAAPLPGRAAGPRGGPPGPRGRGLPLLPLRALLQRQVGAAPARQDARRGDGRTRLLWVVVGGLCLVFCWSIGVCHFVLGWLNRSSYFKRTIGDTFMFTFSAFRRRFYPKPTYKVYLS